MKNEQYYDDLNSLKIGRYPQYIHWYLIYSYIYNN